MIPILQLASKRGVAIRVLSVDLHEIVSTQCIKCNKAYLLGIQQNGNVAELRFSGNKRYIPPASAKAFKFYCEGCTNDEPNLKPKGFVIYHLIVNRSLDSEN